MRRDRVQAVVIRDDKILMVKHKMNGRIFYCLPGGGVEEGETYEDAVTRELLEEALVHGKVIRKLSVQYKPDNRGEVHSFLLEIGEDEVIGKGIDPEFSMEEQTIIDSAWLSLEEIGDVDRAYLWAAGLNRVDFFHEKLLNLDNKIYV